MTSAVSLSDLYSSPSTERLRGLTNADFDAFLRHVFELAGYQVHKDGNTLYLAHENRVEALASVSYGIHFNLGRGPIDDLREACLGARSQDGIHVFGIMITRTDYVHEVQRADYSDPHIVLLNGDHLLRYREFLLGYRLEGHRFPPLAPTVMSVADGIRDIYALRPNVLVIANNRGGIGKSTTALNLAYGLAEKGKSVLAIDMDPQANFTEMLGGRVGALSSAHIGHYFVGNAELSQLVQPTPFPHIKFVAAHPDMSRALTNPAQWLHSHLEFARLLRHPSIASHPQAGGGGFDWVVIDTPPDMGFYTLAAITAANYLLAPTFPSRAGNNGIEILIQAVKGRRGLISSPHHAKFIGFVATRYRDNAGLREDFTELQRVIGQLVGREAFAEPRKPTFLPNTVPDTPRIASMTRDLIKSTQSGQSFEVFRKEGEGRNEAGGVYRQVVEEVLKRANSNR